MCNKAKYKHFEYPQHYVDLTCRTLYCGCEQIDVFTLLASEAAVQCTVIGPVCLCVCGCVCGYVTTITQNCIACIDTYQTRFVGRGSDHLQLIKLWPSCAPGKGVCVGAKFLAPPYYSQRAVFASPLSAFFHSHLCYSWSDTNVKPYRRPYRNSGKSGAPSRLSERFFSFILPWHDIACLW